MGDTRGRGLLAAILLAALLAGQLIVKPRPSDVPAVPTDAPGGVAAVEPGDGSRDAPAAARSQAPGDRSSPASEAHRSWRDAEPRRLATGSPESVGLDGRSLAEIDTAISRFIAEGLFPGAVVLVARRGVTVKQAAYGNAAVYAAQGERLPEPEPMRSDTLLDIASLTKLFTTTAVLALVDDGRLDLDAPVASYLPEFAGNGKEGITTRHLLTHTAGLPPGLKLWTRGDHPEERLRSAYAIAVEDKPGTKYLYSDGGPIIAAKVAERIAGVPYEQFLEQRVLEPLGLADTMYNPPPALRARTAATETLPAPERGVLWGVPHDREARALDGVAGNAGLFSTASDLAVLAEMMLQDGAFGGTRVLAPETARAALKPQPGTRNQRGIGWELNQRWYMGGLAAPATFGHTGFTGTALVVDPRHELIVVLLTNSLHPRRQGSTNPARVAVANAVAEALLD